MVSKGDGPRRVLRATALALAMTVIVGVYLVGLDTPLSNYDEPLYAEMVQAMQQTGDWGTLRYEGGQTLQRPPTAVIAYAAVAALIPGEMGLRLLPAVLTALAALLAGWGSARLWPGRYAAAAGVVAALVAAGAPSTYLYGRLVLSDPPFVVLCVIALLATARGQTEPGALRYAAIALGAGFCVKSMAAAVPLVALAPWWWMAARRQHRCARMLARDVMWFGTLASAYYVVGFARYGGQFWTEHVELMLLDRASGAMSPLIGMGGPFAYLRHIAGSDGLLYTVVAAGAIIVSVVGAVVCRNRALGVAVTYTCGCMVLLSLVSTRLPHYLLIVYPGVGVCAAGATTVLARSAGWVGRARAFAVGLLVVVSIAVFARGLAFVPADVAALPAWPAKTLGKAAAVAAQPGERVFTLDWYAPSFGYYADRPFGMLVSVPAVANALAATDPFLQAGNVLQVPPLPLGALVATTADALKRVGAIVDAQVAQEGPFILVRLSEVFPQAVTLETEDTEDTDNLR